MKITFPLVRDYVLLGLGALLQALAMDLFLVPGELVAGGVSGLSQIVNHYTGLPIGAMILLANVPLFALGWANLGGRRFLARTIFAVAAYSVLLDLLVPALPAGGITDDAFLNSLYGGVLGGAGMGLVFRAQGTSGGTDILARLLDRRLGIPLSQSYLLTDSVVILLAVPAFGWTRALYAVAVLYISGLAAEAASEGLNVVRTAAIISERPEAVARQIMDELQRGVTSWAAVGEFTGTPRRLLYCAVSRAEVNQLKQIVRSVDPGAFVIIGQAYEVIGEGFTPHVSKKASNEKCGVNPPPRLEETKQ